MDGQLRQYLRRSQGTNGVARFETYAGVSMDCPHSKPSYKTYLIGDDIDTAVPSNGNDGIERTKIDTHDRHFDWGDEW